MRTVEIDSQVLTAMQKCLYYWDLRFNRHWMPQSEVPKEFEDRIKLEGMTSGGLGHKFLEHYYSELQTNQMIGRQKSQLDIIEECRQIHREEAISTNLPITECERQLDILTKYCHKYLDFDREMEIILVERPFSKILYESEEDDLRIVYTGVIDLGINSKMTNNTPMDHKTQGKDYPIFDLNNQFLGYAWAMESNWAIVNKISFYKSKKEEDRFKRQIISVSDEMIETWKEQAIYTVKRAVRAYEEGISHKHKEFGACSQFFGCEFLHVCSNRNKDIELMNLQKSHFVGEPWNPYTRDTGKKDV